MLGQHIFSKIKKSLKKTAALQQPPSERPERPETVVQVPGVPLYRSHSAVSIDSQMTLVGAENYGATYIRGHRVQSRSGSAVNRPRSQFTVGPRRVVVCV
ncbi:hypothetical protein GGI07_005137 [Coemansia sp. Benny D115]|nr:hypothetical protein GGI07_005137 [Coemansia sp. Benny D115]